MRQAVLIVEGIWSEQWVTSFKCVQFSTRTCYSILAMVPLVGHLGDNT